MHDRVLTSPHLYDFKILSGLFSMTSSVKFGADVGGFV